MLLFDDEQEAFSTELLAAHERQAALEKQLGRVKAENAELHTKLEKATASLKKAKVSAREALIEMADQNAKLVQAFVDKKRECKQLKAAAREDRKAWQQRLQTMELELQSNKQHIQQLMQQLHAIAAKQVSPIPPLQPDVCEPAGPGLPSVLQQQQSPAVERLQRSAARSSSSANSTPTNSSSTSTGMQRVSSSSRRYDPSAAEDDEGDGASSQGSQQYAAGLSALGDATNRFNSSTSSQHMNGWRQQQQQSGSSPKHSSLKQSSLSRAPRGLGSENAPAGDQQQQQQQQQQHTVSSEPAVVAGAVLPNAPTQMQSVPQQQQQQEDLIAEQQQKQQQRDSRQLLAAQRQMQELQQRARQLEAENAQLRSAQAEAAAQIGGLKLQQQAEQLKQRGNRCFQAQDYEGAAAAYSQALALGVPDANLSAVLLCNRAAAQHAAGQYLDAIADCCLAHQLDAKYPRALQRRAEAYMAIQHYSAAVADLQKLLEHAAAGSSKDVAARLASAQAKQRTHGSVGPNHYLILGLDAGASAAEVKAAYKRLALKHHPDKASGPEAKAAAESVFVLITGANSMLSDHSKRAAYDAAYARSSFLYGGLSSHSSSHSRSSSSSMASAASHHHRHNSSSAGAGGGVGATNTTTGSYAWQYPSSGGGGGSGTGSFAAATHAAAAAAAARAAAAATAAAAQRHPQPPPAAWQHWDNSAADSSTSSHSCASGTASSFNMRV